ncbi:hypothetical protein E0485_00800 [Paenibacillus albiflavus]|uniref:Lipocalin-like domain-containing protein n=1 Tax=Paenibacillus albiflavus TaxID=2545760 RepID=A0A4R4EKX4_9BACL|nr:hypothetical protein [Paenibacillus albiflavus]TCZ80864.1 hypothetical protein E0485_00800 [Paenibacillus albiflavus]
MTNKSFIMIVIVLLLGCLQASQAPSMAIQKFGTWKIKLIDKQTRQEINYGSAVVSEIKQIFVINQGSHTISLPSLTSGPSDGYFQMGYTVLFNAEGYLPRIDHNLLISNGEETPLEIELQRPNGNASYIEYFHPSTMNAANDFISNYLSNIP